jgi:subtilisin family serine protease
MKAIGSSLLLIFTLFSGQTFGQTTNVYLVKFNTKSSQGSVDQWLSPKAIERRAKYNITPSLNDYPVNQSFVNQLLKDTSIHLRYTLKWHNAAVVTSIDIINFDLRDLPFIESIDYVGKAEYNYNVKSPNPKKSVLRLKESEMPMANLTKEDYGVSYDQNNQIGAVYLHKNGYDGSGVSIAIFDAGFKNINTIPAFLKHQANGLLTYGYDAAGLDNDVINTDNHGTSCASCFGAYDKGEYIGTAPKANITLFRTEYGPTEFPIEELNWCKAAELADSMGIDLITSSLGYNEFEDKNLSYEHGDLDGKTSYISLGARIAVEKGIVVLNSAGNQGNNKWRKIGTPADVETVITVGAVDVKGKIGKFSSQGYNAVGVVKPDVSSCGVLAWVASPSGSYKQGYGTSYATPIAAGAVACLMQAYPNMSPAEIASVVRKTGTQASSPDSLNGYGVAQLDLAFDYLAAKKLSIQEPKLLKMDDHQIVILIPNSSKVEYNLYSTKKFLGLFNIKRKESSGKAYVNGDLSRIDLRNTDTKCSIKYTLKVDVKSPVNKYALKYNDLSICSQ